MYEHAKRAAEGDELRDLLDSLKWSTVKGKLPPGFATYNLKRKRLAEKKKSVQKDLKRKRLEDKEKKKKLDEEEQKWKTEEQARLIAQSRSPQ
jgi:hypothetical protein